MTLKQLPNLALFTFVTGIDQYPPTQVFQKQFRKGTGPAKGLTIAYIAQATKVGKAWKRGIGGIGNVHAGRKVELVKDRKRELSR